MTSVIVFAILCLAGAEKETPGGHPQANLDTAIARALELLKNKHYDRFIQQFARPSDLKKILETKKLEDLAESFSTDKAAITIAVLKHIQSAEPTLKEDGTLAEYPVDLNGFPQKQIIFERVDGLWYIRN